MGPQKEKTDLGGLLVLGSGATGAGCMTVIVLLAAIFAGRQLDLWLGTGPWVQLTCILVAIPLSVFMMVRSALSAARAVQEQRARNAGEPSGDRPTNQPRNS